MSTRSSLEDFRKVKELGKGSYGVVDLVRRVLDNQLYVIKTIKLDQLSNKERLAAVNECQLLARLDSPFIVRYYDSFLSHDPQPQLHIVMEYCSGGDLHSYLKQHPEPLPELTIWKFIIQMVLGVAELHRQRILHRDLKTLNVFMDSEENCKIGDLGVSKLLDSVSFANTMVGTPYYISPELVQEQPYGRASDIWALGVIMYELCTHRRPFSAKTQNELICKILRSTPPPISDDYSDALHQLVSICLARKPEERPSAVQILQFPTVKRRAKKVGVEIPNWVTEYTAAGSHSQSSSSQCLPMDGSRTPSTATVAASTASMSVSSSTEISQHISKLQSKIREYEEQARKQCSDKQALSMLLDWVLAHPSCTEEELTRFATSIIPISQIEVVCTVRDQAAAMHRLEKLKSKTGKP